MKINKQLFLSILKSQRNVFYMLCHGFNLNNKFIKLCLYYPLLIALIFVKVKDMILLFHQIKPFVWYLTLIKNASKST